MAAREKEAGDVDGTCSASEADEVAPTEPQDGEEKMTMQAPARKPKRSKGQSAKRGESATDMIPDEDKKPPVINCGAVMQQPASKLTVVVL